MEKLNLIPESSGNRRSLFTDICGGNKIGLTTILVEPLDVDEPLTIQIKRVIEKLFVKQKPI